MTWYLHVPCYNCSVDAVVMSEVSCNNFEPLSHTCRRYLRDFTFLAVQLDGVEHYWVISCLGFVKNLCGLSFVLPAWLQAHFPPEGVGGILVLHRMWIVVIIAFQVFRQYEPLWLYERGSIAMCVPTQQRVEEQRWEASRAGSEKAWKLPIGLSKAHARRCAATTLMTHGDRRSKLRCHVEVMHNISVAPKCFDLVLLVCARGTLSALYSNNWWCLLWSLSSRRRTPLAFCRDLLGVDGSLVCTSVE